MVIDIHSHILPGIDDGSKNSKQSVAMLRMEAQQGISQVVATPHFYAGRSTPQEFLEKRDKAEARLRREMAKHSGLPQLYVGAEVSFFRGMSDSELLPQLAIRGTRCILIELPPPPWSDAVYRELEAVWQKQGLTPIIAHIDRYVRPLRTYKIPQKLARLPVLVQANASFFLRAATAGMALRMLKKGQIHLLGSDCHNTSTRSPNLGAAAERIRKKLGEDQLRKIWEYEASALSLLPEEKVTQRQP